MSETREVDTTNWQGVGSAGDKIIVMAPPRAPMSKSAALVFAAWIVVQADDGEGAWERALSAVQNS